MSSNTFIGVFSSKDSLGRISRWYVAHCMMHNLKNPESEEKWKDHIIETTWECHSFPTRESALVAAHNLLKKEQENPYCPTVEYGVIEI
jgi:hypothetical protein